MTASSSSLRTVEAGWLPTWDRERVLQAAVTSGATSIVVAPLADPSVWIGRHLMIDHPTGPVFREIIRELRHPAWAFDPWV